MAGGLGDREDAAWAQDQAQDADVDEGLLEAAEEQARSQMFMSALKEMVALDPGQKLSFTPPTLEEYAASFRFGFGAASRGV